MAKAHNAPLLALESERTLWLWQGSATCCESVPRPSRIRWGLHSKINTSGLISNQSRRVAINSKSWSAVKGTKGATTQATYQLDSQLSKSYQNDKFYFNTQDPPETQSRGRSNYSLWESFGISLFDVDLWFWDGNIIPQKQKRIYGTRRTGKEKEKSGLHAMKT